MNSLVPSSYLVNQSNKTVDLRAMSLVSALLNMCPDLLCVLTGSARHRASSDANGTTACCW